MKTTFWHGMIGAALALVWTGCSESRAPQSNPETTAPAPVEGTVVAADNPAATGSITGKATIQLRNQSWVQPLAVQIALCPAAAADEIRKVRDARWLESANRMNLADGWNNLDLTAIGLKAVELAVARTEANADGVYRFTQVPPGSYVLYAQYISRYGKGYWVVPVEVKAGETAEADLNNANMAEIYNLLNR
jgi:hypothetical protein